MLDATQIEMHKENVFDVNKDIARFYAKREKTLCKLTYYSERVYGHQNSE